jgi:hypothetical protein
MSKKVSTCLYIDREVLEIARNLGLNVSRVSENELKEAIGRLAGAGPGTGLESRAPRDREGRGRDSDPGARLHRPIGYQATHSRPRHCGIKHNLHWQLLVKSVLTKNQNAAYLQLQRKAEISNSCPFSTPIYLN